MDKWSPRIQHWLLIAGHGPKNFSDNPLLRAFEEQLRADSPGAEGGRNFHQDKYLIFGGGESTLRIGEFGSVDEFRRGANGANLNEPKDPNAPPKRKPVRWPVFATDSDALYALNANGEVVEQLRSTRKSGNIIFASNLAQWFERAVLRGPRRYMKIRWTAKDEQKSGSPFLASGEKPVALASGPDADWWDEPGWAAERINGLVTVWFDNNESADQFFQTPRDPDATLWTSNRYQIPEPGQKRTAPVAAPPLGNQLDAFLSEEIIEALKERGATFEPPGEKPKVPSLEKLLAKHQLKLTPLAIELDRKFAGLVLPDEEEYLSLGIYEMLEGREPWPESKGAPAVRKKPVVPFGVFDPGTRQSLWMDEGGAIHTYSDELGFYKMANSVEAMFEVILFPDRPTKRTKKRTKKK